MGFWLLCYFADCWLEVYQIKVGLNLSIRSNCFRNSWWRNSLFVWWRCCHLNLSFSFLFLDCNFNICNLFLTNHIYYITSLHKFRIGLGYYPQNSKKKQSNRSSYCKLIYTYYQENWLYIQFSRVTYRIWEYIYCFKQHHNAHQRNYA